MKRFGIMLFGVVCVFFIFGCNEKQRAQSDNEIQRVRSDSPTVEWDAPTTTVKGEPISSDYVLKYHVYIDRDDDQTHSDAEQLTKEGPIKETRFTLPSSPKLPKGIYFVGIRALAQKTKDGKNIGEPVSSDISWSSSNSKTKEKPFSVEIK